jgi:hypothetical protein
MDDASFLRRQEAATSRDVAAYPRDKQNKGSENAAKRAAALAERIRQNRAFCHSAAWKAKKYQRKRDAEIQLQQDEQDAAIAKEQKLAQANVLAREQALKMARLRQKAAQAAIRAACVEAESSAKALGFLNQAHQACLDRAVLFHSKESMEQSGVTGGAKSRAKNGGGVGQKIGNARGVNGGEIKSGPMKEERHQTKSAVKRGVKTGRNTGDASGVNGGEKIGNASGVNGREKKSRARGVQKHTQKYRKKSDPSPFLVPDPPTQQGGHRVFFNWRPLAHVPFFE